MQKVNEILCPYLRFISLFEKGNILEYNKMALSGIIEQINNVRLNFDC